LDNKVLIIDFCKNIGLDIIGVSRCEPFLELKPYFMERKELGMENEFEEKEIEKRLNPLLLMKNGKSIISIAFPYNFGGGEKGPIYFSSYTWGRDYHRVVSEYLSKVCRLVEELGGEALSFVDSNPLPERYLAGRSGIGFLGKNNMLITEKYGSKVFLGEIITSLYLEEDEPVENKCGDCELCIGACPTKSISKELKNPNICLSYITQKKHIEDEWFTKLSGRIFGCDSCQDICPYNKKVSLSTINEFLPFEFMENVNLAQLINMDKATFKREYSLTSSGWRGKNIIQRNALISGAKLNLLGTIKIKEFSSQYVKDYYHRLLTYLKL